MEWTTNEPESVATPLALLSTYWSGEFMHTCSIYALGIFHFILLSQFQWFFCVCAMHVISPYFVNTNHPAPYCSIYWFNLIFIPTTPNYIYRWRSKSWPNTGCEKSNEHYTNVQVREQNPIANWENAGASGRHEWLDAGELVANFSLQ